MMIRGVNITKQYNQLMVVKNVSLEIAHGEIVTIVGKSGAGKSTLLHILGTLDRPSSGEVYLNGNLVSSLNDSQLSNFRNQHIGFVFQFHHLLPEFTALENVMMPALIKKMGKKESQLRASELLDYLGLKDRMSHKPSQLSGGEQQRVAVARALMNKPLVIFADEPSGNLDTQTSKELHDLFYQLNKDFKQTFVIVTHNEDLAAMAHRSISMKDGSIVDV
jgi:lipoprotein-releasing system ATP-binding protein